jgi:hypothetical protein
MTDQTSEIIQSLNTNKVLIAILETLGEVSVPALTFLDAANSDKGLVIEYDEELSSFIFKLGEN